MLHAARADEPDGAAAVVFDPNDDVIAAGYFDHPDLSTLFAVAKLDGATGDERWRHVLAGTFERWGAQATSVVTDAAGDVLVSGWMYQPGTTGDLIVLTLDGSSGVERWRYVVDGRAIPDRLDFDAASSLAVDAAGDVVVGGTLENDGTSYDWFVAKVDGASGAERWRYGLDGNAHGVDRVNEVALDAGGDIVGLGSVHDTTNAVGIAVAKLDGATGAERWRRAVVGDVLAIDPWQYGLPGGAHTIDANGDVVVTGTTYDAATGFDLTVAKLAGSDGVERWRRRFDGTAPPTDADLYGPYQAMDEFGADVVTNACGDVFAAGRLMNESGPDFAVVAVAGRDGSDLTGTCPVNPVDGCPPVPRPGCRRTTKSATSTLALDHFAADPKRDRLQWRWRGGEAMTGTDLGPPLGSSDYTFCVYDESAARTRLLLAATLPGGGRCGAGACWRAARQGDRLAYVDGAGQREGLRDLRLKARAAGKSEISLGGRGAGLVLPALPLGLPLRVQLSAEAGACFEATFDPEGSIRNDATRLRLRGGRP